jgi:hypothetical protein
VPPKERLRADQERRPPPRGNDPADGGHEHAVATAKLRPAYLALEDHQLVTNDQQLDLGVHLVV